MSAVDLTEFVECSQRRLANSMVHLKVFEAFAGVGSQNMALRNLGVDYEVVGVSEIDKFAHQSYEAIHGETKNFGDISKLQPEDLPDFDLFTYSFPCFTGDSLVFVKDKGYVPIKDVVVGDLVLTHTGEYEEVTAFYNQGLKPLFSVSSELTRDISTTENHPFYVRSKVEEGLNSPQWKEARELSTLDYLGFPVNTESQLPQGYLSDASSIYYTVYSKPFYRGNVKSDLVSGRTTYFITVSDLETVVLGDNLKPDVFKAFSLGLPSLLDFLFTSCGLNLHGVK